MILAEGRPRAIDVAEVNGHVFLCASMLGLPARLARYREGGRGSLSALRLWSRVARAALRAIAHDAPLRVALLLDNHAVRLRTAALTITVNPLDDSCGRTFGRSRLDGGELAVYAIGRLRPGGALRLLLRLLRGRWQHDPMVQERHVRRLAVGSGRAALRVMNDGEVRLLRPPLRYRIRPRALCVIAPAPEDAPPSESAATSDAP